MKYTWKQQFSELPQVAETCQQMTDGGWEVFSIVPLNHICLVVCRKPKEDAQVVTFNHPWDITVPTTSQQYSYSKDQR